jgi:fructokinase
VLNGENLKRDLAERLNQPVFMANDADCFTLSEAVDGAGKGYCTVFGVIVGTGCGGGVVVNGQLLNGPNAIAGEWGTILFPAGAQSRMAQWNPATASKKTA